MNNTTEASNARLSDAEIASRLHKVFHQYGHDGASAEDVVRAIREALTPELDAPPLKTSTDTNMDSIEWAVLTEEADERRSFDRGVALHGDVRLAIAHGLEMFAIAMPRGSFAEVCKIMANEVAKLHLPPAPAPAPAKTT